MCPVAKPQHVLQRLVHDVSMIVSCASNTASMVQRDMALRMGVTSDWAGDSGSADMIAQAAEEYNRELAEHANA